MKVFGRVLACISMLFLVTFCGLFIAYLVCVSRQDAAMPGRPLLIFGVHLDKEGALIGSLCQLGAFVLFGLIAHVILKTRDRVTKADKFFYGYSYVAFVPVVLVILALFVIVKFIDIMIGLFTGGEKNLKSVTDFLLQSAGFKKKAKSLPAKSGAEYQVYADSRWYDLTFVGSKEDVDSDSPYFTKNYNRFRDELGGYWRSYDNNVNFIKETPEQISRGY